VWAAISIGNEDVTYPALRILTAHWNGQTWRVIASPHIEVSSDLGDLIAIAPNDVWAVGSWGDPHTSHMLAMHWDGNAWSLVPVPSPGPGSNGSEQSALSAVSAVGPDDVWAVGDYEDTSGHRAALAIHWDGTVMDIGRLDVLTALSSSDIWAANSEEVGQLL